MCDIAVGDRRIIVRHAGAESTRYGEIQRYRVTIADSEVATGMAILRTSVAVDARALKSVIENELVWE